MNKVIGCSIILLTYGIGFSQPIEFKLYQNVPNPFDTSGTRIRYDLGAACFNRLWVEDTVGNVVKTLVSEQEQAGFFQIFWDARNNAGEFILPGSYTGRMLSTLNSDTLFSGSITMEFQTDIPEPLPSFTDIMAHLEGVRGGSVAWGDYDNDGDLDILLTGATGNAPNVNPVSKIYRNDARTFVDTNAGLTGVSSSGVAWGDYDNDGDLDIVLTGLSSSARVAKIYRNDGGNFVDIGADLMPVSSSSAAWGDYDNDGDLDLIVAGETDSGLVTEIFRNENPAFVNINSQLVGVARGSVAWGDYDNDGDMDLLLIGSPGSGLQPVTKVYRNDGGTFVDIIAHLLGLEFGAGVWGDYDNDGDLDILVTGFDGAQQAAKIYRNVAGDFVDSAIFILGTDGSVDWGDYDNDGDLDFLLTGWTGLELVSAIYRNEGESFVDIDASIIGVSGTSDAAWGDYDNDGDLDVLLTGDSTGFGENQISKIYRNNIATANTIPSPPTNLRSEVSGNSVTLSWDKSTDVQTSQNSLTYNVRVGTTPNGGDGEVISPMADAMSGYRLVPQFGNTNHNNSWTVTNLPDGTFYWSVQAIDNGFAGSAFAEELTFIIGSPISVDDPENEAIPTTYELSQSFPNPFNSVTKIRFGLPTAERVTLKIYNLLGEEIAALVTYEQKTAGYHEANWNGRDNNGSLVSSGVYIYRLSGGRFSMTKKMILLR